MEIPMRRIYVIGFAPKGDSAGTGGFHWHYTDQGAIETLESLIRSMPFHTFRYSKHDVYPDLTSAQISALLNQDPESWEPPEVET